MFSIFIPNIHLLLLTSGDRGKFGLDYSFVIPDHKCERCMKALHPQASHALGHRVLTYIILQTTKGCYCQQKIKVGLNQPIFVAVRMCIVNYAEGSAVGCTRKCA